MSSINRKFRKKLENNGNPKGLIPKNDLRVHCCLCKYVKYITRATYCIGVCTHRTNIANNKLSIKDLKRYKKDTHTIMEESFNTCNFYKGVR